MSDTNPESPELVIENLKIFLNSLKMQKAITPKDIIDLKELHSAVYSALDFYREKDDFNELANIYITLSNIYDIISKKGQSPDLKNEAKELATLWKDKSQVEIAAKKLRVDVNREKAKVEKNELEETKVDFAKKASEVMSKWKKKQMQ